MNIPKILRLAAILLVTFNTNAKSDVVHTGKVERLVEGYSSMTISDNKTVEFNAKEKKVLSPNGTYAYHSTISKTDEPSRFTNVTVKISAGDRGYVIGMTGVYGDCEIRWISEKLLFLRTDWARHWGTDYIFDVEAGRVIYEETFNDAEWVDRQKKSEPVGADQPATAPESKPEGGKKPQPKSEPAPR